MLAGEVVRDARLRAGLTQVELADRAGIAQSVVSAYESSRREPSVAMLRSLVAAAGFDLDLVLARREPAGPLRMRVDRNSRALVRTLRGLGAERVRLFGSVARGEERPGSDIDLLVDVGPDTGLIELGRMRAEAERILGSSVDIVPANSLKPDVAAHVLAEAIAL
jgi:predicted nucleotidyltransferase/DNA-binding XRE family transcriptional regulator